MKLADAPPPGWYPDPRGGSRLRWWDGGDWTDSYRSPPSVAELELARASRGLTTAGTAVADERFRSAAGALPDVPQAQRNIRRETEEVIAEVRKVARSEVDRAADLFSQRARVATRELQPLITQYTSRIFRWLRIALVVIVVLVVAWVAFQVVAQENLFNWIGDRIDNLTED